MATINDFKLIDRYALEYFKNIKTKNIIHEKNINDLASIY